MSRRDKLFLGFIDEFWKTTPSFKKFKTKRGWSCRKLNRDDACDIFLRTYINNLYGKYCCEDLWVNHAKFKDYDYQHFKKIINLYLRKIFENYIPCDVYEKNNPQCEINSLYDGWGEDSYVVTYIIRSLKGYLSNRMKKYSSGRYFECSCGELALQNSNHQSMCKKCRKQNRANINREYYKNKKLRPLENPLKP